MRPTVVTVFPQFSQAKAGIPSGPQRWQTRCPSVLVAGSFFIRKHSGHSS